jgi:hypothetical protein
MDEKEDFLLSLMFHRTIRFVSAGTATETIRDQKVRPGWAEKITSVSIVNFTSGFTRLRVGSWDGNNFQPNHEHQNPVAANLHWSADSIYLSELECLMVEVQGCTSGDKIEVYVDGFYGKL